MTSNIIYHGELRNTLTHLASGQSFITDAPLDNRGKGQAFSPTDLVAAAIASCMMTLMGITARKLQIDVTGATLSVEKEMATAPVRRVSLVKINIQMPAGISMEHRALLEKSARGCPVIQSLHPEVKVVDEFFYS